MGEPDMGVLGDALRRRDATGPDTPIPFGKAKGTPLRKIDGNYLRWCLENLRLRPDYAHMVRSELLRRWETPNP